MSKQYIEKKTIPYLEQSVPELLQKTKIEVLSLAEVLKRSEIIFVAVQTPHDPLYEGITKLPSTTADFNYDYLKAACSMNFLWMSSTTYMSDLSKCSDGFICILILRRLGVFDLIRIIL